MRHIEHGVVEHLRLPLSPCVSLLLSRRSIATGLMQPSLAVLSTLPRSRFVLPCLF